MSPSGFRKSLPSFASSLLAAMPMLAVSPRWPWISRFSSSASGSAQSSAARSSH
jgi:hypothetical protein